MHSSVVGICVFSVCQDPVKLRNPTYVQCTRFLLFTDSGSSWRFKNAGSTRCFCSCLTIYVRNGVSLWPVSALSRGGNKETHFLILKHGKIRLSSQDNMCKCIPAISCYRCVRMLPNENTRIMCNAIHSYYLMLQHAAARLKTPIVTSPLLWLP